MAGSRIALSRGLNPERFLEEVRQYGVSVVTYTWSMLRQIIDDPDEAVKHIQKFVIV